MDDHSAILLLGSNISPQQNLRSAHVLLSQASSVCKNSRVWQTPAYGSEAPDFLNQVIWINTGMPYKELKQFLKNVEKILGRVRSADKYAPRTIDLDILVYDGEVRDENVFTQPFAAIPAADVFPEFLNPENNRSLLEIAGQFLKGGEYKVIPE
jgi:2-amino-4-hydroxy-6-hydroxymethyldihydropteridine diphosphokinase